MKKSFISRTAGFIGRHKFLSTLILIIAIGAIYGTYYYTHKTSTEAQYAVAVAERGMLTQTVTGSGQVSSQNQLDIKSEVSGEILTLPVTVGQFVTEGTIIATIDPHTALIDLENARISYAKLTEPAKERDVTLAERTVEKANSDSFTTMVDLFSDLPTIMDGLDDLFYTDSGFLSDQRSLTLNNIERGYREAAGQNYDNALKKYTIVLARYKSVSPTKSRQEINALLAETIDLTQDISNALKDTQNTITYIIKNNPNYNSTIAASTADDVISWQNTINSNLNSLIGARNDITSALNNLETLTEGAEELDIKSEKLSLAEKERTYEKYFIRAPFDGVIGRIPVSVHDTAANGTVIATLASQKKITNIPLNEVDAVKVVSGNKVTLTFDALDNVSLMGTVISVDTVGVASQGVVTYNIKIAFTEDDARIKPGMSVDATITTEERTDTLLIPSSAIKTRNGRKYVEVLDRSVLTSNGSGSATVFSNLTPTQIEVTIGDTNDTSTEILDGITAGDVVVTRTIAGNPASNAQSSAPSIFSRFGGQRNTVRTPR